MHDAPDPDRLKVLDDKLKALRQGDEPNKKPENHERTVQAGWRMVVELVVGMAMGFGIGYGLDSWFETLPIFLILFTLLGFAGGVRAMMRSAAEIQEKQLREQSEAKEK